MSSVDISIIIVNWNSKDYLRNCIASILANTHNLKYEIIVIDSASYDGCSDMLQNLYPKVHFIQSEYNIGFARANNLGANYAHGTSVLFLNPDTEVREHAIERLYSRLKELPDAGIIGCRLLNSDGSLQTSCVQPLPTIANQIFDAEILQRWFPKINLWISATKFEDATSPVPVEAVSGACMMIQREVFNLVRGFSTDYFMYAEDLDLCYKIHMAGHTNYYVVDAEIIHYGGGSTQHKRSRFSEVMIPESTSRLLKKIHNNSYSFGYRIALSISAVFRLLLLTLCFPVSLIKLITHEWWSTAINKWFVILRWGLGLEKWVHEYDFSDTALNSSNLNHGGESEKNDDSSESCIDKQHG